VEPENGTRRKEGNWVEKGSVVPVQIERLHPLRLYTLK